MEAKITPAQMKRLQVLYSQLVRTTFDGGDGSREARLAWASQLLCRSVSSFRDLTQGDARHLIDVTQQQLGVKVPARKRDRLSGEKAMQAGTEGRRDGERGKHTLVGPRDLARIQYALDLLAWTQEQLEGWLRSPRSPLGKRSNPSIRTVGDANRVWWALKRMAQSRGLWKDEEEYRRRTA
jgi:hypothetical protein